MSFLGSTYYDLLELQPDASDSEVRAAYERIKATYGKNSMALYSLFDEEDTENQIEEAYKVLSHPDRRKQYNIDAGIFKAESIGSIPPPAPVVSIDRVPPMDRSANDELLVPPITDTAPHRQANSNNSIEEEILKEQDWSGAFLKRVREAKRVSIEEISNATRVSKNYLLAIEDENFGKLPAAVFVRGFVTQLAKILKLPPDKVSSAYLERYRKSGFDKNR